MMLTRILTIGHNINIIIVKRIQIFNILFHVPKYLYMSTLKHMYLNVGYYTCTNKKPILLAHVVIIHTCQIELHGLEFRSVHVVRVTLKN